MRLWNYTAGEIGRRPGRMLLTLLGITLGLATAVATRLTTDTVRRAYRDLFASAGAGTALEVTSSDPAGFDASLTTPLESVCGVRAVVPQVQGVAAVAGDGGNVAVAVVGTPLCRAADGPLCAGRPIADADEALLDASLADAVGLRPGRPFALWAPTGRVTLRVAGVFGPRRHGAGTGGRLIVSLACAQRLFALPGRVNSVRVSLADRADAAAVQEELARRLPPGLMVQPPGMRSTLGQCTLRATEQGLAALGVVGLVAAGCVVLNTFLLSLGERRRQLAILRALGATRAQVTWLLLREMLLLGLAGTVAGCAAGVGLAMALLGIMERFLGMALPHICLTPRAFLAAPFLGPGLALVAAVLPAWLAGRRPPLAELLPRSGSRVGGAALRRLTTALPFGLIGTLAGQQLTRHPTRTLLTGGVLSLALAVTICFGQALEGVRSDLRHWYRETIVADFLVYGSVPDTAFLLTTALPGDIVEEIGRLDGVEAVDRLAFLPARSDGRHVLILARTFSPGRSLPLDLREGEAETVRRGLMAGEVVLGVGLAQQMGLHRGDAFPLTTPCGPRSLRVAGTAAEYAAGGSALYVEWEAAHRLLDVPGVHVFLVSARAADVPALAPRLREFCEQRHLVLESNAELRLLIDREMARVTGALWALLSLVFVIAALGVVNTLLMNVHDQRRQIGVLRALGLKRGQVRLVVLAQGVLLGSVSVVPGSGGGVALAYLIHRLAAAGVGLTTPFRVDGLLVVACCTSAVIVALLASLLPARRAVGLSVAQLLTDAS